MIKDDPGEEQGAAHDVGPEVEREEYVVTDYEYDESDQELDEEKDVEEARSDPHLSKAPSDPRTVQKGDTDYLRSLEEAVISLKLQLFTAEARDVRAEKRVEVITQEADELAELLIRQLDD
ncbi:unnamed protein product [Lactuca saligna]|uniref:Uncharacterized protein n=1 Tax=Lactuca saligna TaxID=75948 RepID=A0AA35V4W2_LACSI|nr:unnamed protein product [Lactuca saligna]